MDRKVSLKKNHQTKKKKRKAIQHRLHMQDRYWVHTYSGAIRRCKEATSFPPRKDLAQQTCQKVIILKCCSSGGPPTDSAMRLGTVFMADASRTFSGSCVCVWYCFRNLTLVSSSFFLNALHKAANLVSRYHQGTIFPLVYTLVVGGDYLVVRQTVGTNAPYVHGPPCELTRKRVSVWSRDGRPWSPAGSDPYGAALARTGHEACPGRKFKAPESENLHLLMHDRW